MSARDPVCGQEVDMLRARAVAIVDGQTWYFCSAEHKETFLRDRTQRAASPAAPVSAPVAVAVPLGSRRDNSADAVKEVGVSVAVPVPDAVPESAEDEAPAARRPRTTLVVTLALVAAGLIAALLVLAR